jgi:hypothetical protein
MKMNRLKGGSTTILVLALLIATIFAFCNPIQIANAGTPLTIHLWNTAALTNNGIDVEVVKAQISAIYAKAGIDVTFSTEVTPNSPGHIQVTFLDEILVDDTCKPDPNMYGTRAAHSGPLNGTTQDRITFVSVKAIMNHFTKFLDADAAKAALQKANLVALMALHETGEVYLEDYDGTTTGKDLPYVMNSNVDEATDFKNAQSPDLKFSETAGGGPHNNRKSDKETLQDRIPKDKTDYSGEDDEVSLISPSNSLPNHGDTVVCTLLDEEGVSRALYASMKFTVIRYQGDPTVSTFLTDENGTVSFLFPNDAVYADVVAYNSGLAYAHVRLSVGTIGGVRLSINKPDLLAPYFGLSVFIVTILLSILFYKRLRKKKLENA